MDLRDFEPVDPPQTLTGELLEVDVDLFVLLVDGRPQRIAPGQCPMPDPQGGPVTVTFSRRFIDPLPGIPPLLLADTIAQQPAPRRGWRRLLPWG